MEHASFSSSARENVLYEAPAWESIRPGWRQLYGNFYALGVSVEEHDFRSVTKLDWGRSFHPESVELCLNMAGSGEVSRRGQQLTLGANAVGLYAVADEPLAAHRRAGERHRFMTIELSHQFIARQFADRETHVDPVVREGVFARRRRSAVGQARPLSTAQQALAAALWSPPVAQPALTLWYEGKVLEALAMFFFPPAPEMFCARQKRLALERVERTAAILRARSEAPPTLEELGREVGVSPFHLSRIFSEQTGMTIPQYLRQARIERAAELLRSGGCNVTEVAFQVGYSSLGHFSKAFCEVIGCCPSLYPHATTPVRKSASHRPA